MPPFDMRTILAVLLLVGGTFFAALGVVGFIRFPDVYCRVHAAGKAAVFGVVGIHLAIFILDPASALKSLALIVFLLLTTPVTAHVITTAAYRVGVPMTPESIQDDLASKRREPSAQPGHDRAGLPALEDTEEPL